MPLEKGESFPPKDEAGRIKLQAEYRKIYLSEHVWNKVINNDGIALPVDPLVPIAATISEISSDLLYGEFPTFDFGESQEAYDSFLKERSGDGRDIRIDLMEASVMSSAQGMLFWNLFKKENEVWWNFRGPENTLWETDFKGELTNIKYFDLLEEAENKKIYAVQEYDKIDDKVIFIDYIIVVNKANNKIDSITVQSAENIGLNFIPSVPIYNLKVLNSPIGKSDYEGKQQIFAEIDNRVDQINNVLQEHSDPWVGLPAGVLDQHGTFFKKQGKMFEKSAAASNVDNTVDHFTWDASLEAAFKQIENLIRLAYSTSRIATALSPFADFSSSGGVESGRSLKWRSVTTIAMINRKQVYQTSAIKRFFNYLAIMQPTLKEGSAKDMRIEWRDGLPTDDEELVSQTVKKVSSGLLSKLKGSEDVNEWDESEALKDQEQISKELSEGADIKSRSFAPITV